MHYQIENVQDKLIRVVRGTIYDVAVDLENHPQFWQMVWSNHQNKAFCARGFHTRVTSKEAEVLYKTIKFL